MQTPRCFSKKNDDEQVNFKIDLRPRFLFLLNFFFFRQYQVHHVNW